ncbi:MAG: potassium channel family protein [Luteolibacter sp.]
MPKLLLFLFLLVSACVAIHGAGMMVGIRWLGRSWPRKHPDFTSSRIFWLLVRVVYGLLLLHLIQIAVWAAFYQIDGCFPDFETSFYYSATSYSTVGYGDVVLRHEWRILGAMEAVTGVIMFGWSTGVLFTVVHHLHSHFLQRLHTGTRNPNSETARQTPRVP